MNEDLKHLDRLYNFFNSRMKLDLEDMHGLKELPQDKDYVGGMIGIFSFYLDKHWLHDYYIKKDLNQAKQSLSILAQFYLQDDSHLAKMVWGWESSIFPILLSDNASLIDNYVKVKNYESMDYTYRLTYEQLREVGSIGLAIQAILQHEYSAALQFTEKSHTLIREKIARSYHLIFTEFLQSLIRGNKEKMPDLLHLLVSKKMQKQFRDELAYKHCAINVSVLLKLAWIRGHELEIDHRLIPMDLMPVQPLDHYEIPYFFLPGYQGEIPPLYVDGLRERYAPKEPIIITPDRQLSDLVHESKITADGIETSLFWTDEEEMKVVEKDLLLEIAKDPQSLHRKSFTLENLQAYALDRIYQAYFGLGNLSLVKQEAYLYNLATHMKARHWGYQNLAWSDPYHTFSYLISDHPEMMQRYMSLPFSEDEYSSVIQTILRQDATAKMRIKDYLLHHQAAPWLSDALIGLHTRDEALIREAVLKIANDLDHRESYGEEYAQWLFFCPEANLILKIAWMIGMEIEIEHDMILMPLMVVKPLPSYHVTYDFMKDE